MKDILQRALLLAAALTVSLIAAQPPAAAQTPPGAICISTFADLNANGVRDEGEAALAGVNTNLATGGAIIATHISATDEEQFCFEDLLPGVYTLTFTDSPTYRPTTSSEGTFALAEGQRLTINAFGAVPVAAADLRDEVSAKIAASNPDEPLEPSERLVFSGIASMFVMLLMIGVGAVILGVMSRRRRRRRRPANPTYPDYTPGT